MVRLMTTERGERKAAWSRGTWAAVTGVCLLISAAAAFVGVRTGVLGSRPESGDSASQPRLAEPSQDANRWVNGAPISIAGPPGKAILIEAWHPA